MIFLQKNLDYVASFFFLLGILHTFFASYFRKKSDQYPHSSFPYRFFHLIGEAEIPLGLWAAFFSVCLFFLKGKAYLIQFFEQVNFVEPLFVFAILTVAATKPILKLTDQIILWHSHLIPLPLAARLYCSALLLGPIMGSFITEPAAMTVTALFLRKHFFLKMPNCPSWFKYLTIGLLFTNISIGGALTNFAAPPVLVVAEKFGWDTLFMLKNFGFKVILSLTLSTFLTCAFFWKSIFKNAKLTAELKNPRQNYRIPKSVTLIHVFFLFLIVYFNHYPQIFLCVLVIFFGWHYLSRNYQDELHLSEALVVTFFLGALMIMGKQQAWWVSPILSSLSEGKLFLTAMILTAFNDNAAITYLASFVDSLGPDGQYLAVSGALAGGGLTVIANAPNPAGSGLLKRIFASDYGKGDDQEFNVSEAQIHPIGLLLGALPSTIITALIFYLFHHFRS